MLQCTSLLELCPSSFVDCRRSLEDDYNVTHIAVDRKVGLHDLAEDTLQIHSEDDLQGQMHQTDPAGLLLDTLQTLPPPLAGAHI